MPTQPGLALDQHDFGTGSQPIDVICPLLHQLATLRQMLRIAVRSAHVIPLTMRKQSLYRIPVPRFRAPDGFGVALLPLRLKLSGFFRNSSGDQQGQPAAVRQPIGRPARLSTDEDGRPQTRKRLKSRGNRDYRGGFAIFSDGAG
jgi:hypothetical protein